MTGSAPAAPPGAASGRWRRDVEAGLVGGVLAGLARRLEVDPLPVRIAFGVLVLVTAGAALLPYLVGWALLPRGEPGEAAMTGRPPGRTALRRHSARVELAAGAGLLALAALLGFREIGLWWSDALAWPLVLASAGAALLWPRGAREPTPVPATAEGRPLPATGPTGSGPGVPLEPPPSPRRRLLDLYRGGFGVALVTGAALLFLSANDALGPARDAAFTAIVAIVALALVLAPFLWRLGRNLAAERAERIRSQEKAELAAHLHDSVLQTLTLIERRAAEPGEVVALARRQQRELRSWLAGGERAQAGLASALRSAAEEVEDDHRVRIETVIVGDCELDEGAGAIAAAAREALTNAAKFGAEPISLYCEVTGERIEAFVHDRGEGFDPGAVPTDRRGIRESIIGRMERHGGSARIEARTGRGTEVALALPREQR